MAKERRLSKMSEEDKRKEREANYFAMELLMPESLVLEEVEKMGGVDLASTEQITQLAKIFQVEVPVMSMRLGQIYNHTF